MRLVITSCADTETADSLAVSLVEERLVACVNILPVRSSVYRWEGQICREAEQLLILKTSEIKLTELTRRLQDIHPYDVPEILTLTPSEVSDTYLQWVLTETQNKAE